MSACVYCGRNCLEPHDDGETCEVCLTPFDYYGGCDCQQCPNCKNLLVTNEDDECLACIEARKTTDKEATK